MKVNLICSMVAMSAVSLSASAEEGFSWGDVTFQPRAYAGYADYSLKSSDFNLTIFDSKNQIIFEGKTPVTFNYSGSSKLQITGPILGF
ncbi:MAG: hypothetical protein IPL99_10790 [Candidatus Competibacteraceae bacterium]|nr:hypothetical protein [Candidatus Competibacteraceae bacterium]